MSTTKDLAGKVFLVTGGTEGIGKAAALEFARRGATIALVARSREKGERVASELRDAGAGPVELLLADLSKQREVRALAAQVRAKYDRLDVLVNNAGAVFTERQRTEDGIERTFALNHVAYWLLTQELRGLLAKTPGARVVSTSSGAHAMGRLDLHDVARRDRGFWSFGAYGDSKLANILFTRELARTLAGTGVTANCFHPGFVRTGFGHNNGKLLSAGTGLIARLFARTPEKGAETLVYLATSPEVAGRTGEYWFDKRVARTTPRAKSDELARALWKLTEELCAKSVEAPRAAPSAVAATA